MGIFSGEELPCGTVCYSGKVGVSWPSSSLCHFLLPDRKWDLPGWPLNTLPPHNFCGSSNKFQVPDWYFNIRICAGLESSVGFHLGWINRLQRGADLSSLVFLSVFCGCRDESRVSAGAWVPAPRTTQVSTEGPGYQHYAHPSEYWPRAAFLCVFPPHHPFSLPTTFFFFF